MSGSSNDILDLVIIGGGPGGLAAGIYAGRARLKTVILEKGLPGGTILLTWSVDNYPGFPTGEARELAAIMEKQARDFGCEFLREEAVDLKHSGDITEVVTDAGVHRAKGVIISTGARSNPLGVPGEKEYTGRGVSYCATCDGAFFHELPVAVIGGGDTAVEEAMFLTRFASRVYLVHRRNKLRATQAIQEELMKMDKVEIVWDTILEEVNGDGKGVCSVALKNVKTGRKTDLEVQGVFIFIGISPNTGFLKGKVEMDEWDFIITDDHFRTNIPGVYAVGDVRSKEMRQIINAAGEGATAAYMVEKTLKDY
jgi:thioredoxin reductase (NADPH)